jgi:hypothetical protein
MDANEILTAVRKELQARPVDSPLDIPALVQDYGPGALEALQTLRRERFARLVAIGGSLTLWLKANGYTRDQVIEGPGEVFIQVERRGE